MTGEPEEAGILPRSLDVIFNSIADVQAPRYVRIIIVMITPINSFSPGLSFLFHSFPFSSTPPCFLLFYNVQVFCPDGANGYDIFSEEEANIEHKRNKPKKIGPRVRSGTKLIQLE